VTVKTDISRFDIHDELSAPEGSQPIVRSIQAAGGELPKLLGVLAGSPAGLRAYARLRSELRKGALPAATRERIALAVTERRGDAYGTARHAAAARAAGVGLDEISKARSFDSSDPREKTLLLLVEAALTGEGDTPLHLLEEAREVDWTDEQILEALTHVALVELESLIANLADLPQDHTSPSVLPSAA
jgi:AhpD family alkylhydroperoxidase